MVQYSMRKEEDIPTGDVDQIGQPGHSLVGQDIEPLLELDALLQQPLGYELAQLLRFNVALRHQLGVAGELLGRRGLGGVDQLFDGLLGDLGEEVGVEGLLEVEEHLEEGDGGGEGEGVFEEAEYF